MKKAQQKSPSLLRKMTSKAMLFGCGVMVAFGCATNNANAGVIDRISKVLTPTGLLSMGVEIAAKDEIDENRRKNYKTPEIGFKASWDLDGSFIPKKLRPDDLGIKFHHFTLGQDTSFKKITPNDKAIETQYPDNNAPYEYIYVPDSSESEASTEKISPEKEIELNLKNISSKTAQIVSYKIMEKKMGQEYYGHDGAKKAPEMSNEICDFLEENRVSVPDYGKEALEKGKLDVFLHSIVDTYNANHDEGKGLDEILDIIPDYEDAKTEEEEEDSQAPKPETLNNGDAETITSIIDKGQSH